MFADKAQNARAAIAALDAVRGAGWRALDSAQENNK